MTLSPWSDALPSWVVTLGVTQGLEVTQADDDTLYFYGYSPLFVATQGMEATQGDGDTLYLDGCSPL